MFDSLDCLNTLSGSNKKVVVAMSGGVDSSLVAAYLARNGCSVIGVTLRIYDDAGGSNAGKACCAGKDIADAQKVARDFGFPHYVIDHRSTFKKEVIDEFISSYNRGETPIPCILCNQTVKFRDLFKVAKDVGADALATGHYVRRKVEADGSINLYRAVDDNKDQSYFLFSLKKELLHFLRFPLGGITKGETRNLAKSMGIALAEKPDSQDICFVRGKSYRDFIKMEQSTSSTEGYFISTAGKVLGRHEGIANYTVGQRRGIGISSEHPLYVVSIDAASGNILVGSKEDVAGRKVLLSNLNWLDSKLPYGDDLLDVEVKLRSHHRPISAKLKPSAQPMVWLQNSCSSIAPGQACVIYEGNRLLGGGWIAKHPSPE